MLALREITYITFLILATTDVIGYVTYVIPLKEGKKSWYFEVYIRTEAEELRVVSFDSDVKRQFGRRLQFGVALSNVTKSLCHCVRNLQISRCHQYSKYH